MVFDVFFKIVHILKIIIVGVVSNDDVGVGNDVFQKAEAIDVRQRKRVFLSGPFMSMSSLH